MCSPTPISVLKSWSLWLLWRRAQICTTTAAATTTTTTNVKWVEWMLQMHSIEPEFIHQPWWASSEATGAWPPRLVRSENLPWQNIENLNNLNRQNLNLKWIQLTSKLFSNDFMFYIQSSMVWNFNDFGPRRPGSATGWSRYLGANCWDANIEIQAREISFASKGYHRCCTAVHDDICTYNAYDTYNTYNM